MSHERHCSKPQTKASCSATQRLSFSVLLHTRIAEFLHFHQNNANSFSFTIFLANHVGDLTQDRHCLGPDSNSPLLTRPVDIRLFEGCVLYLLVTQRARQTCSVAVTHCASSNTKKTECGRIIAGNEKHLYRSKDLRLLSFGVKQTNCYPFATVFSFFIYSNFH